MDESKCANEEGRGPSSHLNESTNVLQIDPDKVLKQFGTWGRYQIANCFMTTATSAIYAACILVMPFLTEKPDVVQCRVNTQFQDEYLVIDSCNVQSIATGVNQTCISLLDSVTYFDYGNATDTSTLTTAFNLVCEDSSLREHTSSFFLAGSMLGSTVLSQLSDRLGRKRAFLYSIYIALVANMCTVVAPNYIVFLITRAFAGFSLGGNLAVGYVMLSEVVAPKGREYTPFATTFFWVSGYMWAGLTRIWIEHWRWVYFANAIPGVFSIIYIWIFPESLHWLVANGKKKGIKKYIRVAARFNGLEGINLKECQSEVGMCSQAEETSNLSPFVIIFKQGKVLFQFCICCFLMLVMNMTYWALSLFSKDLSEDKMTGFFLSGLIEWPAAIFAVILMRTMKRRPVNCLMFVMTATCLFLTIYVAPLFSSGWKEVLDVALPLLAKMFNSIAWSVLPLAMSEMIPTLVRNTFCGGVGFVGDIGSVVSPYLELLTVFGPNTATTLIFVLTIICAPVVLSLPETKGKHLVPNMSHFDEGPVLKFLTKCCNKENKGKENAHQQESEPLNDEKKHNGESRTRPTFNV